MWNRLRNMAALLMDAVVAFFVIVVIAGYIGISSFIMTSVVNDLRLDTYIDFDTGFGIVSLVLFLVWVPIWLLRESGRRR